MSQSPSKKKPRIGFGHFMAGVSLLGFGALCFLAGAAAMHFGARPLREGFAGAEKVFRGKPKLLPDAKADPRLLLAEPGLLDGYALFTSTDFAEARLIDRKGNVVHNWRMPATDWKDPIHWERCLPYPNGDLLALCCPGGDQPYGFGVVKIDKDSKLLWKVDGLFHHDIERGPDGRVWLIEHRSRESLPAGLEALPLPCYDEAVVTLSPDGERTRSFSLLESFVGTPYLDSLLAAVEAGHPDAGPRSAGLIPSDVLHANSLRLGKGGLLVSFRTPSLIATIDPETKKATWAAKGPWRLQHDAQFLPNGHLLLFDNVGTSFGSRVLEYDPATHSVPWSYGGTQETSFRADFRGRCQRLPDGSTRLIDPERGIFDVDAGKRTRWRLGYTREEQHHARHITGGSFFLLAELPFLKGR